MKDIKSFADLIIVSEQQNKKISQIFLELESFMLDRDVELLKSMMLSHLNVMKDSIKNGLASSEISVSGHSGGDSQKIFNRYKNNANLPFNGLLGNVLSYSIAVMEENQRMGKIVACPTAGSCGIVPAVIVAYSEYYDFSEEEQINALITAGGIGKIIAQKVALAGAVAGCQAECGASAAMAAGAVAQLMGGCDKTILHSAALALKNTLGLVCDPVAGLVEIPCVKRNGFYAVHSATAAEMALSGVESAIPIDEVVDAMKQIGALMSPVLKETSQGGLAVTETGIKINQKLQKIWEN